MSGVLEDILASKREEIAALASGPSPTPRAVKPGLVDALSRGPSTPRGALRLIAEIKQRSPSAGELSRALSPADRALAYARAGAAMISVLTDGPFFGGSFADLRACRDALDVELGDARPYLLCKEFVLDPVQLDHAAGAGADAALLIVRCLDGDPAALPALVRAAEDRGLVPLVEVTHEDELARALSAGARVIGVNARDLDTLRMDPARAARVLAQIDPPLVAVHLSGLRAPEDVRVVAGGRADAALIGEALMREDDPRRLLAAMVEASRDRRAQS